MARVEAEAGQLGEELPRRGAFFVGFSRGLGFSVGALGSDLAEKRTTRTSSLVVWSLSLFRRVQCLAWCGVSFEIKLFLLKSSEQPPAPPFGTFRNTVPARTVRNVPGEREAYSYFRALRNRRIKKPLMGFPAEPLL